MSGNLAVSTINGVDISVSPVATQAFASSLLAEYIVSGSAVTSINFSGLDINTHKSYRVEIEFINVTSLSNLYMFINGDTTLTNYQSQVTTANATTSSSTRNNTPTCIFVGTLLGSNSMIIDIIKTNGYISALFRGKVLMTSNLNQVEIGSVDKVASITNLTQLAFTAQVASAIGVGSKIRIYRGDV